MKVTIEVTLKKTEGATADAQDLAQAVIDELLEGQYLDSVSSGDDEGSYEVTEAEWKPQRGEGATVWEAAGGGDGFYATCLKCAWEGGVKTVRALAKADAKRHLCGSGPA